MAILSLFGLGLSLLLHILSYWNWRYLVQGEVFLLWLVPLVIVFIFGFGRQFAFVKDSANVGGVWKNIIAHTPHPERVHKFDKLLNFYGLLFICFGVGKLLLGFPSVSPTLDLQLPSLIFTFFTIKGYFVSYAINAAHSHSKRVHNLSKR